jgi:prepilin-type N-terminal cleavage/methylation domain-containing protein
VSRLRADDGFSLVELLVTTVIMGVVFSAALGVIDMFQRQAVATDTRGDAQDATRRAADEISQRLRGVVGSGSAAAVDRSATNDLVFRVVDPASPPVSGGANAARLMYVRFCVNATTKVLYEETFHWTTATAPNAPDNAAGSPYPCPGTGWQTVNSIATGIITTGGSIFTFLPSASAVAQVNIDLTIDKDTTKQPPAVRIRTGVSLRNLNQPPTVVLNCAAVGGSQVICDAFGTADPDGGALTYAWSYGSGSSCTSLTTLATTQSQINQAGLSAGPYCFRLSATDPTGMSASATQVVTAR